MFIEHSSSEHQTFPGKDTQTRFFEHDREGEKFKEIVAFFSSQILEILWHFESSGRRWAFQVSHRYAYTERTPSRFGNTDITPRGIRMAHTYNGESSVW